MLRMVSARKSPLRNDGPQPRDAPSIAPGHQQVVLAVGRALRVAGGAAGVRDPRGRVRVDVARERIVGRGGERVVPLPRPVLDREHPHATATPPARRSAASHSSSDVPLSSRRNCFSGGARARLMPTHTAPRRMAPWKARITSRSLGSPPATRSPARTPSATSACAARDAQPVELGVRPPAGPGDQRLAVGIDRDDRSEDVRDRCAATRRSPRTAHARSTCRCCNSTIIGSRKPMYALVSTYCPRGPSDDARLHVDDLHAVVLLLPRLRLGDDLLDLRHRRHLEAEVVEARALERGIARQQVHELHLSGHEDERVARLPAVVALEPAEHVAVEVLDLGTRRRRRARRAAS